VADAPAPVLLPLIRADDDVTPALERALHPVAIRAQTGDRAARDALYTAFEPKLMRFTWRIRVPFAPGGAKGIWERDDVVQEAYLAFISMVENWSPAIPFGRYVLANFPWRLRDAVHRGVGKRGLPPRTHGVPIDTGAVVVDASTAAVEQRTLLLALAASLERPRDEVFRLHIVDGLSLTEAALRMGISRRTITRHWRAIMLDLRSDLITRADGDPIDR
jgi:RNA polymerase sigma factor (sigma-70 family)